MPRTPDTNVKHDILRVLTDYKIVCSIQDIKIKLKNTDSSKVTDRQLRYALKQLLMEGKVKRLPRDGNGSFLYVRITDGNRFSFSWFDGKQVTLKEFIHLIEEMKTSGIIKDEAWSLVRESLINVLISSDTEVHRELDITPSPVERDRQRLEDFNTVLSKMHAFIKRYLNNNLWSESDRELLGRELKASCSEEQRIILERMVD